MGAALFLCKYMSLYRIFRPVFCFLPPSKIQPTARTASVKAVTLPSASI